MIKIAEWYDKRWSFKFVNFLRSQVMPKWNGFQTVISRRSLTLKCRCQNIVSDKLSLKTLKDWCD